ncbi:chromatin modification- protein VID21 [Phytophthora boehmeriae]|uniref:Chromatin modification- protein VID21 n=1 Tax=Phytophthora boehmeriae TaxID=109152 RepID=A0A8T1X4G2_9STRA|nr:chromatin modification- protein VID21 [Phytophthora boehmeriae]
MSDTEAPLDDCEYPVALGRSLLTETAESDEQPEDVAATFGYEFQPASVDKTTPGLVSVDSSKGVQVLMGSSTGAAGGVSFKGKLVEHKDTDCLLIFDGSGFRLERCPFSCMQLRHVRAPTPRRRMRFQASGSATDSVSVDTAEPKIAATATGKRPRGRPKGSVNTPTAAKPKAPPRKRERPKGSTNAAKKARTETKTLGET